MASTIVWLRDDLRLDDNPALAAAASLPDPMNVVYILDEVSPGIRPLRSAAKWWLHHSLAALSADLGARDHACRSAAAAPPPSSGSWWNRPVPGRSVGTDATGCRSARWTPASRSGPPQRALTPPATRRICCSSRGLSGRALAARTRCLRRSGGRAWRGPIPGHRPRRRLTSHRRPMRCPAPSPPVTTSTAGGCSPAAPTGAAVSRTPGCPERKAPTGGWRTSWTDLLKTTGPDGTSPGSKAPAGCPRIFALARSARSGSGTRSANASRGTLRPTSDENPGLATENYRRVRPLCLADAVGSRTRGVAAGAHGVSAR